MEDNRKEYFHSKNCEKYRTQKAVATEIFKDKMFKNKGPTFDQLPKRIYDIDYHINHNDNVAATIGLQRSKYMKVDDNVEDFNSDNENEIELRMAYSKARDVELKNRRILCFKSCFLCKLK